MMGWLESAGLVLRTSIIDSVSTPLSSQAQENRFRLYLMDVGLLGALAGLFPGTLMNYHFGSYQGYVAENFVAQELRAAGIQILHGWQGRTSEIEFVVETPRGPIPIEVKSGHVTRSQSLNV